jgi:hypothetical protein
MEWLFAGKILQYFARGCSMRANSLPDRFHDPRTREGVAPVVPIEVGSLAGQAAVPFFRPDVPKYQQLQLLTDLLRLKTSPEALFGHNFMHQLPPLRKSAI